MVNIQHVALHRYFIWADRMRADFDQWLRAEAKSPDPLLDGFTYLITPGGTYMSLWYAALYVVIEGWCELKLRDAIIDERLVSENTALLKRYRHGVCHFQRAWLDPRLEEFCTSKTSTVWARQLHSAFGAYFRTMYSSSEGGA